MSNLWMLWNPTTKFMKKQHVTQCSNVYIGMLNPTPSAWPSQSVALNASSFMEQLSGTSSTLMKSNCMSEGARHWLVDPYHQDLRQWHQNVKTSVAGLYLRKTRRFQLKGLNYQEATLMLRTATYKLAISLANGNNDEAARNSATTKNLYKVR